MNWALRSSGIASIALGPDAVTLKSFFMYIFFTSIGFAASFGTLKKMARPVIIMGVVLTLTLGVGQNLLAFLAGGILTKLGLIIHPMNALTAATVALLGGPGTTAGFAPTFNAFVSDMIKFQDPVFGPIVTYVKDGITLSKPALYVDALASGLTAATWGIVWGGIIGTPITKMLIDKYHLLDKSSTIQQVDISEYNEEETAFNSDAMLRAFLVIFLSIGLGYFFSYAWKMSIDVPLRAFTLNSVGIPIGLPLPVYIGGMLFAAIIRNIIDSGKVKMEAFSKEVECVGNISLTVFLCMELMSLRIWELASIGLPLIIILVLQLVLIGVFSYYVCFKAMGKDYDAAVMTAGFIGFASGTAVNSLANMNAISSKYNRESPKAYLVVSLACALFVDFCNSFVIAFSISIFGTRYWW